jgi:transposase
LSTKIHTSCDANGNPTGFYLSSGQAHDLTGADMLMEVLTKAERVIGDKGYDADKRVRKKLAAKGCIAVIPFRKLHINPGIYDKELYKKRHLIENFFAKLKQYRAIATRYDKTATNFLGAIYLAAAVIRMN